jgi:hypothetical protein
MKGLWPKGMSAYLVRPPGDVLAVAAAGWALRRAHWLRRAPHLPLPDPAYWQFRVATAFGDEEVEPSPADVAAAARWSRRQRRRR